MHGDGHARGYAHDNDHGHVHRRNSFAFPVHVAAATSAEDNLKTFALVEAAYEKAGKVRPEA
jgi:hypothetical protein